MMIEFKCNRCNSKVEAPVNLANHFVDCPRCQQPVRVPQSDDDLLGDILEGKEVVEAPVVASKPYDNSPRCRKCGSTLLSAGKKGFSIAYALIGGALLFPLGLLAGLAESSDVTTDCGSCGFQWLPKRQCSLEEQKSRENKHCLYFFLVIFGLVIAGVVLFVITAIIN